MIKTPHSSSPPPVADAPGLSPLDHAQAPADAPEPGVYRHYKGSLYQVMGVARHSETEQWMVVYQALYGEMGFWLRPLSLWLEPVVSADTNDDSAEHSPSRSRFTLLETNTRNLASVTEPG